MKKNFAPDIIDIFFITLLSFLPVFTHELLKKSAIKTFSRKNKFSRERVITKLSGLYATYAVIAFIFWLLPFYNTGDIVQVEKYFLIALPVLVILAVPYVIVIDMHMPKPKDSLWHVGNFITRREKRDTRMLAEYAKAWAVKLFFGTLMVMYFVDNISSITAFDLDIFTNASGHEPEFLAKRIFNYTNTILFSLDLLFACVGYIFTLKLFDSHIRSSEPTLLGWLVCIMCYQPIWGMFNNNYLSYDDAITWQTLAGNNIILYYIWGGAILFCVGIYALATIAFGIRFSNLTYRGVITNGPYRFTKHPAYVFKNLSWWLISVPFISYQSWDIALRNCILLLGINFIYYLRARTEENHLSNYPEYVQYAEYMNEHSIFRCLTKPLPFLKYSAKRAKNSGSKIYKPFAEN